MKKPEYFLRRWLAILLCLLLSSGCVQSQELIYIKEDEPEEAPSIASTLKEPVSDEAESSEVDESQENEEPIENEEPEPEPEEIANDPFDEFLQECFVDMAQQSYILAHNTFIDPSAYGIDLSKTNVSLGTFLPRSSDIALDKSILDGLNTFDYESLSESQQMIYDQLYFQTSLDYQLSDSKFDYQDGIWGNSTGVQVQVEQFFSLYTFYSTDEIHYLLILLSDLDNYVKLARSYTAAQAKMGLLQFDEEYVVSYINQVLSMKEQDPVTQSLITNLAYMDLSPDQYDSYYNQIRDAVQEHFYPCYEKMLRIINEFKSYNQPISGMAAKPDGRELYELYMQYYSGTDYTIEQMQSELSRLYNELNRRLQNLYQLNPGIESQIGALQSGTSDIWQIVGILQQNYENYFPAVATTELRIDEIPALQAQDTSTLAYMVTTPMDYQGPYNVYYNPLTSDFSSMEFFYTLAHESIPGHVYEQQYDKRYFTRNIQYFLSSFGYQEGWATYAGNVAIAWSGVDSNLCEAWKLSRSLNHLLVLQLDMMINVQGLSYEEISQNYTVSKESYTLLCQRPALFFAYYYDSMIMESLLTKAQRSLRDDFDWIAFNEALLVGGSCNLSIINRNVQNYIDQALASTGQ